MARTSHRPGVATSILRGADVIVPFGIAGDLPVLFDYDGDGKADLCVVRDGIRYANTRLDGTAQAIRAYGVGTDVPFAQND